MASISSISSSSSSIESLVQQYMAVERQPITTLNTKKASLNTTSAVYNDLKTKLTALKSAAASLADTDNDSIYEAVSVSSSDSNALGVTAGSGAAQGQYTFRVRQLATATRMQSTADLNTKPSVMSSSQVVAGTGVLETDETWADAGFDVTPDGTVTINGVTFTLSDYTTVDDFMEAVNEDETANANIYYDSTRDRLIIESTTSDNLVLSETGTNGFLTEVNIASDTYSTNTTGLNSSQYLHEMNFDTALESTDSGSFKINGVTITWDAGEDTLNTVITEINNSAANVTAFYDDTLDRLVITSDTAGSEAIEWEDVEGSLLGSVLKFDGVTQSIGDNAIFTINSTDASDEITKSSNSFSINGLNITLKAATVVNNDYTDSETTSVTVTSRKDESLLKNKINAMLSAFNNLVDYLNVKTAVDTTTYERGALAGDSLFVNLKGSLAGVLLDKVNGLEEGKPSYLSEIGITLGTDLHASISDAGTLSDFISDDPYAVADLLRSDDGIAARLEAFLEPYTENYGIIDDQRDAINYSIDNIDTQINRLEERMERREAYYRQQFTSLQELFITLTYQQTTINNLTSSLNSYTTSLTS